MIIYKATNKIDNKCYIGQTIWLLDRRIKKHIYDSKKSNSMFARAIKKYGMNNFKWTILEVCMSEEDLNEKEQWYIKHFDSFNEGYNMNTGGNSYKRKPFTEEHKKKISESTKGRRNSDEAIKRQADKIRGTKQSQEVIDNRVKKMIGHLVTIETRNKISIAQKGIPRKKGGNSGSFKKGGTPWNKGLKK
jgi:group I intron endonuclease